MVACPEGFVVTVEDCNTPTIGLVLFWKWISIFSIPTPDSSKTLAFKLIVRDESGLFIKKTVLRPRPWAGLDLLVNHLVGEKGRNYSFPSNHAANMTGLAMVFSSIYYRYGKLFWTVAGIVMFSRVYIGVHYPSDVMAGCILGCVYGLLLVKGWKFYHIKTTS